MDGPEGLEALLGAKAGDVQWLLGSLALGADELATWLLTLRVGALRIYVGGFGHGRLTKRNSMDGNF